MRFPLAKRPVVINGRNTSVSVEDIFWTSLEEVAHGQAMTLSRPIGSIEPPLLSTGGR